MTKVNDHINFRLQQLEEKQSNSSANNESINAIPSQASPITESVATRVNDEYRSMVLTMLLTLLTPLILVL